MTIYKTYRHKVDKKIFIDEKICMSVMSLLNKGVESSVIP